MGTRLQGIAVNAKENVKTNRIEEKKIVHFSIRIFPYILLNSVFNFYRGEIR